MFGLGTTELIIIFLILVFLFGARRLPKLAGSIGEGIRAFRSSSSGEKQLESSAPIEKE